MRFQDIAVNFLLSALIIVSLFAFIVTMQTENSASQPIAEDPLFNQTFQRLQDNINSSYENSSNKYDTFNNEDPVPGFGSIVLFGVVNAGKTFSTVTFGFFSAVIKFPLIVLGISPSIVNIITTMLIILVIIGLWAVYKLGG